MAKVLSVPNGDYYVYVQDGGVIRLDTGIEQGRVEISGDLVVEGNTTTVSSEDLSIRDNIITVNDGETGAGVTLDEAGLLVDRGTEVNGLFVWDETVTWTDPVTEGSITGAWHAKNVNGGIVGIRTNSITTGGGDLYLINSGTGVISVTGTNNYEDQVTDDDHVPNKKYLVDYVDSTLSANLPIRIEDGTVASKTYVEAQDFETTSLPSVIAIGIDESVVATIGATQTDIYGLRIEGTHLQVIDSNEDLILSAAGTGLVRVDDMLQINSVPGVDDATTVPSAPLDGVTIYTNSEDAGGTGVFFVNQDSSSGELISKNKALVFSMVF
jgi:hypothetical protein